MKVQEHFITERYVHRREEHAPAPRVGLRLVLREGEDGEVWVPLREFEDEVVRPIRGPHAVAARVVEYLRGRGLAGYTVHIYHLLDTHLFAVVTSSFPGNPTPLHA